jgi:hypothetical protein
MKKLRFTGILVSTLMLITFLQAPALAEQPGSAEDPLVTRRYVDNRITALQEEIALLRGIIANIAPGALQNLPQAGATQATATDLLEQVTYYVESIFTERIQEAIQNAAGVHAPGPLVHPQAPAAQAANIFQVINPQAGQIITFEAGTEFILRGGSAIALTGPLNGIPDVTAGTDVMNGTNIELNHLMMIPFTDGRGLITQAESWIMVRGGYILH